LQASVPAWHVAPKAASLAFFSFKFLAFSKSSASLGFDPGFPASIYFMPKLSRASIIRSLSSVVKDIPGLCAPSRRVVSYKSIFMDLLHLIGFIN
jgi:hypothetical protein